MPEHWYTVPALLLSGRDAKALRCVHCLTRIEGTGPRSVRYMRDHVRLVHDFERVPEPHDSREDRGMSRIEEWRAARVAEAHRTVAHFNDLLGISLVLVEEPRLEVHASASDFGALSRWSREHPMDEEQGRNVYGDIPVVVVPDPRSEPHDSGSEADRG